MKTSKKQAKTEAKTTPSNVKKSRKQVRKAKRQEKKVKKLEYYANRNKVGKFVLKPSLSDDETPQTLPKTTKQNNKNNNKSNEMCQIDQNTKSIAKQKRDTRRLKAEMEKRRHRQMIEANRDEDKNIKRLEKQLKLNKRKSKTIPKTFASDGLDYLLEVCDSDNMKDVLASEMDMNVVNGDFDEDFALMTGSTQETSSEKNKNYKEETIEDSGSDFDEDDEECNGDMDIEAENEDNLILEEEEEVDEESLTDSENDEENIDFDSNDENPEENVLLNGAQEAEGDNDIIDNSKTNSEDSKIWEDIYGRIRDKDGNVITAKSEQTTGKYIPPGARAQLASNASQIIRLKRQLKGSLNRLAESNMHSICSQIETLYMANSRNDMNETLTSLIFESTITNVAAPERLLLEHVLLISILHANIGSEVGAHFLQSCVKRYHTLLSEDAAVEDKHLDNVVNVIAQLYNFKLFNCQLLYDILLKLAEKFEEKHVECILNVLKNVGFTLRKDDPGLLKNLILNLQKKAATDTAQDNPRVKFMLDILLAIKNNNVNKIPNYDTTYSEHLKKISKSFIRKGNYVTLLNIGLDDLLKADERGKWWVVGSAWTGKNETTVKEENQITNSNTFSQKLLALAKKQRMNTDTRRNVFCIIMSAEDYLDAFEKLLHLGLKNQQEREIINVLLHCCLTEKKYNPYYSILAQKFCDYDRPFQMMIKFSIWDKLKALIDCSPAQISNLAKLLTHLFLEKGLPISTLKIVQFGEMDKVTLRFMRQILLGILLAPDLEQCQEVFSKVSQTEKLKMFRESLRLFIHHFLLRNLKSSGGMDDSQKGLLEERAKMVEKLLTVHEKNNRFV